MKRPLWLFLLLAVLLSACSLTVRPNANVSWGLRFGFELSPIITRFEPDRGNGSSYRVGESVRFLLSLNRSGYVTLVGIDSDGLTYEFDRLFLNAGTHVLTGPAGFRYEVRPPYGLQRVRAIFTDVPHPSGFRFQGRYSSDGWDSQTSLYFQGSGSRVRDVAETRFFIR